MTTLGGDVGEEGASETAEPVAVVRRGPDRVAVLAWISSIVVAMVLAAFATVGFQTLARHWPTISERWQIAILEAGESDQGLPVVEPLPGAPPVSTPETEAIDAARVVTNPAWLVRPRGRLPSPRPQTGHREWSGRADMSGKCPRLYSVVLDRKRDAGGGQASARRPWLGSCSPASSPEPSTVWRSRRSSASRPDSSWNRRHRSTAMVRTRRPGAGIQRWMESVRPRHESRVSLTLEQ